VAAAAASAGGAGGVDPAGGVAPLLDSTNVV
jgi:hypothetical protein